MLLATLAKESLEALAQTSAVVTKTTAGAVEAFGTTISSHGIRARGTLTLRAVRSAEADVALASVVGLRVVGEVVRLGGGVTDVSIRNEVLLRLADTVSRAVTRADSSLASITSVTISALANAGNSVANTTARAFRNLVSSVRVRAVERNSIVVCNVQEISVIGVDGDGRVIQIEINVQSAVLLVTSDGVSSGARVINTSLGGNFGTKGRLVAQLPLELERLTVISDGNDTDIQTQVTLQQKTTVQESIEGMGTGRLSRQETDMGVGCIGPDSSKLLLLVRDNIVGTSVRANTLRAISASKGIVLIGSTWGAEADAAVVFITPTMTATLIRTGGICHSSKSQQTQNAQHIKLYLIHLKYVKNG